LTAGLLNVVARLRSLRTRRRVRPARPRGVRVEGYADDCLVRGELDLAGARLSDFFRATPQFPLWDAHLVGLADGQEIEAGDIEVARDELVAVQAAGPRGDPLRRRATVRSPVVIRTGPYRIRGDAHAGLGNDPLYFATRRGASLPLTDVRLQYRLSETLIEEQIDVLVVNVDSIDSMIQADPRGDEFDD
jgi:hypothetical protein